MDNVTSWTGLKLEDLIRKVDVRSAERRFIVRPALGTSTAKGKRQKAMHGKPRYEQELARKKKTCVE